VGTLKEGVSNLDVSASVLVWLMPTVCNGRQVQALDLFVCRGHVKVWQVSDEQRCPVKQ
jgi:hypothetical protein